MSNDGPAPTPADKQAFERAKKELLEALTRKRAVDKQLVIVHTISIQQLFLTEMLQQAIEVQIYNLESSYLTDTAAHSGGNILQGFEGYLKNPPGGRRKYEVSDADRMFSNSSATHKKVNS